MEQIHIAPFYSAEAPERALCGARLEQHHSKIEIALEVFSERLARFLGAALPDDGYCKFCVARLRGRVRGLRAARSRFRAVPWPCPATARSSSGSISDVLH